MPSAEEQLMQSAYDQNERTQQNERWGRGQQEIDTGPIQIGLPVRDSLVLGNYLYTVKENLNRATNYINFKKNELKILNNTSENLNDVGEIYNTYSKKMEDDLYNIQRDDDVNKRLIEFYSKDYDLKKHLKRYFKYGYYILILVLVILLYFKKLHKNKKIIAFVLLLLVFPRLVISKIYDSVIGNVGHFKLDVLYTLLIIISIGIGYGGFLGVKKLISMLLNPKNIKKENKNAEGKNAEGKNAEGKNAEGKNAEGKNAEGKGKEPDIDKVKTPDSDVENKGENKSDTRKEKEEDKVQEDKSDKEPEKKEDKSDKRQEKKE